MLYFLHSEVQHDFLCIIGLSACIISGDRRGALYGVTLSIR